MIVTSPVIVVGMIIKDLIEEGSRNLPVTASASILIGVLAELADRFSSSRSSSGKVVCRWKTLVGGVAPLLAQIPSTSLRNGYHGSTVPGLLSFCRVQILFFNESSC